MPTPPRPTLVRPALALLLLLAMVACGGAPRPDPDPDPGPLLRLSGTVLLPPGAGLALADLEVVTAWGSYPVAADGSFEAEVADDQITVVQLEDEAGQLVLSGLSDGEAIEVSVRSSALHLIYLALGGFTLPSEHQATLWALLQEEESAVAGIAAELSDLLLAGEAPMQAGSDALEGLLTAARDALLPTTSALRSWGIGAPPAAVRGPASPFALADDPSWRVQQGGGAGNIVIEPGAGVLQDGAAVLHNPAGSGIAVQNHQRRPVRLLAYQVGYRDADQVDHDISPPVLAGQIDADATSRLSFFTALSDAISDLGGEGGQSPWAPELSAGLPLPLYQGTQRTYYELVLLGPGFLGQGFPHHDVRFQGQLELWEQITNNLAMEQFITEFVWPLIETYVLGKVANLPAAEQRLLRTEFLAAVVPHLASSGIYLGHRNRYLPELKAIMDQLLNKELIRRDILSVLKSVLVESQRNQLHLEAIEARLARGASAAAISSAVTVLLASADVGAILHDLAVSTTSVSWQATASPALFYVEPEVARFSRDASAIELTVHSRGPAEGHYAYRWSTSGRYGDLFDASRHGTSLDTHWPNVWYMLYDPTHVDDSQSDTVLVEVFELPTAGAPIPDDAMPLARLSVALQGMASFERQVEGGRLEFQYDTHWAEGFGGQPPTLVHCGKLMLHIPKSSGATAYDVTFSGYWGGGQASSSNPNYQLRNNNTPYTHSFSSSQTIPEWPGVCLSRNVSDTFTLHSDGAAYVLGIYDVHWSEPFMEQAAMDAIALWIDWASEGGLKVSHR